MDRPTALVFHHRRRDEDQRGAPLCNPAAPIVIIVEEEDILVEPSDLEEERATNQKAGSEEERGTGVGLRDRKMALRVLKIWRKERARLEEHAPVRLNDLRCEETGFRMATAAFRSSATPQAEPRRPGSR